MNILNFIQAGGFPMDVNTLSQMQTGYNIFNALGQLAGDLSIIKGCEINGGTISDGIVYIDGEVLEFRSGIVDENVVIVSEAETKTFENGSNNEVHYTRYAAFGAATVSYPWSEFKRLDPITAIMNRLNEVEKKSAVFTAGGGMVLWNKPANQIPEGWQEVEDWRGRMPVGFDNTQTEFDEIGKTGGTKNKTLSISEIPEHDHGLRTSVRDNGDYGQLVETANTEEYGDAQFTPRAKTQKTGGGQSFSLLNPYRTVLFIEYIG